MPRLANEKNEVFLDKRKSIGQDTLLRIRQTGAFGGENPGWLEQRDHEAQEKPAICVARQVWGSHLLETFKV